MLTSFKNDETFPEDFRNSQIHFDMFPSSEKQTRKLKVEFRKIISSSDKRASELYSILNSIFHRL